MKNKQLIIIAIITGLFVIGGLALVLSNPNKSTNSNTSSPSSTSDLIDLSAELKKVTPIEACTVLPVASINAQFVGQDFKVFDERKAQQSGYLYISSCEFRSGSAGNGVPTHVFSVAVRTNATESEAGAYQITSFEDAKSTSGYKAQPSIEEYAYSTVDTGSTKLYFQKGLSLYELTASNLTDSNDARTEKLLKLAQEIMKK
jgi:hypothetical protein